MFLLAGRKKNRKMKKIIFSLICICACLPYAGAVVNNGDYDVQFVNNNTEEFTGLVGQIVTRTGLVRFADAEIPPDPNQPVDRFGGFEPRTYTLEIQNDESNSFSAWIVWRSSTSNECTVTVTYHPNALGTHNATLWLHCSSAGVPTVKIPLRGEATGTLGDLNGDGLINIGDVAGMINLLLLGDKDSQAGDMNGDGRFSISDVTELIYRLLAGE